MRRWQFLFLAWLAAWLGVVTLEAKTFSQNLRSYTGIVTPGLQDVCGAALATNAVTVNGGAADRHGEYFHRQISVANTNQPVWQAVATGGQV